MNKTKHIVIILSVVLSISVILGALIVARSRQPTDAPTTVTQHAVSKMELAKANGKNGAICYVAVDGTVYQIKDFSLWQDGEHVSSNGLAYCGADLSNVIDQAPHGRSILDLLIKIGPLES